MLGVNRVISVRSRRMVVAQCRRQAASPLPILKLRWDRAPEQIPGEIRRGCEGLIRGDEHDVAVASAFEHRRVGDDGDVRPHLVHARELLFRLLKIGMGAAVGDVEPVFA